MSNLPSAFTGSIPRLYEQYLVPVIFTPYAEDLVARVAGFAPQRVLEVACGTGIVTRRLLERLPASTRLVATDLNQAMIDVASARTPHDPRLTWRVADGTALPFGAGEFDAVTGQFGVMFYPDRPAGLRSARSVLKPGGRFVFNVWSDFSKNPFGRIAHETIGSFFTSDPPKFYETPFGWADPAEIERTARDAGFRTVKVERVAKEACGDSIRDFAIGLVSGNPVIGAINERGLDVEAITLRVADALSVVYGDRPFRGPLEAIVVTAEA